MSILANWIFGIEILNFLEIAKFFAILNDWEFFFISFVKKSKFGPKNVIA